jgi:amino acid adenylation domain-containing protein
MKYDVGFYCHLLGNPETVKKIVLGFLAQNYKVKGIITEHKDIVQWANERSLSTFSSVSELNETDYVFCMMAHDDIKDIKINDYLLLIADYKKIIFHWNDNQRSDFIGKTIIDLIELQTQKRPDNIAVVNGDQTLTYQALENKVNQLACHLTQYVSDEKQSIALCVDRGIDMITGILSIMKAGAAYIPLTPDYPKDRLVYILNDAKPTYLLVDDKYIDLFSECSVNKITFSELDPVFSTEETAYLPNQAKPDTLAYMIYTSGSTGMPKGVMIPQQAVANHMLWMGEKFCFDETDIFLQKTPFSFDASVWELLMPLAVGAKLVFASPHAHQDPYEMIQEILNHQVTVLQLVPSMLREFLWYDEVTQCYSLKHVFVGGESLTAHSKKRFSQIFPDKQLHNLYGPTEATIDTTSFTCDDSDYCLENNIIGQPISNAEVYVFDRNKILCPIGKSGELYIGGVGLATGYHNQPELTEKTFIDNPFGEHNKKIYRTGDLVQWLPDGNLKYICRMDEQVKIQGCRIEIGEIEMHIKEHDSVKDVVVLTKPIGDTYHLIAFITSKPEKSFDESSLREFLASKLPHFMLPSYYAHVDQFPKLPNGKVNRRQLLQDQQHSMLAEPEKESVQTSLDHEERLLMTLWRSALGNEKISITDNFFDVGGTSLSALKILTKIRKHYDILMRIQDFLENPTIAELAAFIRQAEHKQDAYVAVQYHDYTFSLPVITLKKSTDASQAPLFLIHPVGGTVFWFASLVKYLTSDISICAIQTPELELGAQIFPSIEETAKCYVDCIRRVQPHGPYRLGGSSFGANVAIEMARQLADMSEKVEFIVLFDGWAKYPSDLYDFEYFKKTMQRQYNKFTQEFKMQTVYDMDRLVTLQYKRLQLLKDYRHSMIESSLFLFKSQELLPEYEMTDDACNYWQTYAQQKLSTVIVPGNHETMFYKPNVQVLAEAVDRILSTVCDEKERGLK